MGWKEKWHPRGQNMSGNIARGLGLSLHTWGGRGHASDCDLTIHPDGSVDIKMGTQDIGTGTRTTIAIVAADTLGLTVERHQALYRRHAVSALGRFRRIDYAGRRQFLHAARGGGCSRSAVCESCAGPQRPAGRTGMRRTAQCSVKCDPGRSLSWKEACSKIGAVPITAHGNKPGCRQEQARSHQQRCRRRADGRRRSRHRNRHRQSQEDGGGAGLWPDHRPEDGREQRARRADHGHQLLRCSKRKSWTRPPDAC